MANTYDITLFGIKYHITPKDERGDFYDAVSENVRNINGKYVNCILLARAELIRIVEFIHQQEVLRMVIDTKWETA